MGIVINSRSDRGGLVVVPETKEIALGNIANAGYVLKFGRNNNVDTSSDPEDVWNGGGLYTGHPTGSPELVTIVSSSTNDASGGTGARTIRIFGLKTSTSTEYESEDITMNGTTSVDSANSWYRINRAYVLTAGSANGAVGNITIAHKVTTANVFAVMPATFNQTTICAWTVPYGKTAIVRAATASIIRSAGAAGSATLSIRIKAPGSNVYTSGGVIDVATGGPVSYLFQAGPVIPSGYDVLIRCDSVSDNGTLVSALMEIVYIDNG